MGVHKEFHLCRIDKKIKFLVHARRVKKTFSGGDVRIITILHRGAGPNDNSITWGEVWPKDYRTAFQTNGNGKPCFCMKTIFIYCHSSVFEISQWMCQS